MVFTLWCNFLLPAFRCLFGRSHVMAVLWVPSPSKEPSSGFYLVIQPLAWVDTAASTLCYCSFNDLVTGRPLLIWSRLLNLKLRHLVVRWFSLGTCQTLDITFYCVFKIQRVCTVLVESSVEQKKPICHSSLEVTFFFFIKCMRLEPDSYM